MAEPLPVWNNFKRKPTLLQMMHFQFEIWIQNSRTYYGGGGDNNSYIEKMHIFIVVDNQAWPWFFLVH